MTTQTARPAESDRAGGPPRQAADSAGRRLLQWLIVAVLFVAITFGSARTPRWPAGRLAPGFVLAGLVWKDVHLRRRNPGLMERRRRRRPETPWWDRALVAYGPLCGFTIFAVAGLDGARRHTGYGGLLVDSVGLALLFGAPLALIPALLTVGWILPRTLVEERVLHGALPGYAEYVGRVRWRWIPGIS
jgi:protein-S-isoprenylcysteine O-methyltransferase Ste14